VTTKPQFQVCHNLLIITLWNTQYTLNKISQPLTKEWEGLSKITSGGSMLGLGGHRPPDLARPPIFNWFCSNFA